MIKRIGREATGWVKHHYSSVDLQAAGTANRSEFDMPRPEDRFPDKFSPGRGSLKPSLELHKKEN
ncbi:MAG: hypothetical protein V2B18_12810 [Pseudomonadota bacterium]